MSYIDKMNQFWQTQRIARLSPNEGFLYLFLVHESNTRMWENPFECPNGLICATIKMSEKTLIDVRNRLQQKGLISFESGKKNEKSPVYTLLYCKNESKTVSKTVGKVVSKNVSKTVNIKEKSKTEEKDINKEYIKEKVFDLGGLGIPEPFIPLVQEWIDFRKELKDPFKLDRSVMAFYNKLKRYSNLDISLAKQIIDNAISRGYLDIYELKSNNQEKGGANGKPSQGYNRKPSTVQQGMAGIETD